MHWAEQLVKTAKENNFTLEQVLDEGWLAAWFANYWAAVRDPLQTRIEELEGLETEIVKQGNLLKELKALLQYSIAAFDKLEQEMNT
jgi:hypothetical protein